MKRWEEEGWQEDDLNKLELSFLRDILKCREAKAVDGAIAYASYLNKVGVNSDNYPIYLKLLAIRNHWVVDALVGTTDPDTFFGNIQANYYIIRDCFQAFAAVRRGGIYEKSLLVYLGMLRRTYHNPLEGYRIYPVTISDVNHLGKHLNEEKDQMFDLNKSILSILDKIASLLDPGNTESIDDELLKVATQANNIRGKFLDMTKSLSEAIPDLMLQTDEFSTQEVPPSKS